MIALSFLVAAAAPVPLVVYSPVPVELAVDGERVGQATPTAPLRFTWASGQRLQITCGETVLEVEPPPDAVDSVLQVRPGTGPCTRAVVGLATLLGTSTPGGTLEHVWGRGEGGLGDLDEALAGVGLGTLPVVALHCTNHCARSEQVHPLLRDRLTTLRSCVPTGKPVDGLGLTLAVGEDGVVRVTDVTGPEAKVNACVVNGAKRWAFPADAAASQWVIGRLGP
jgi:hypothetical protein